MFQYVPGPLRKGLKDKLIDTKPGPLSTPNLNSYKPVSRTPKVLERPIKFGGGNRKPPTTDVSEPESDSSSSSSSSSSEQSSSSSSSSNSTNRDKRNMRSKIGKGLASGIKNVYKYSKPGLEPATYRPAPNEFSNYEGVEPSLLNKGQTSKVDFSTNLKPTVTLNEFKMSSYSGAEVVPKILMNLCSLGIGFTATGATQDTYMNEIFQTYNRDVANTIRNTTLTSSWSLPKFKSYVWKVCYAMEYYYALDSILSYDPKTTTDKDKSLSMINYQSRFQDFSVIQKKDLLEKYLRGYWLPPRMSQLIRWLFQSYKISDLEQAVQCRFVPSQDFVYDGTKAFSTTTISNTLSTIIADLSTSAIGLDNINIASILSQVYPDGRITNVAKSSSIPNYDRNWMEIFCNQPNIFVDENNSSSTSMYPFAVSGSNTDIPYYVDRPLSDIDGFCFALQAVATGVSYGTGNLGVIGTWQTSMLEPIATSSMASGNNGNKYIVDDGNSVCTRRDTYVTNSGSPDAHEIYKPTTTTYAGNSAPLPGWQRVYFDNVNAPTINLGYFMDWLFGNLVNL